MHDIYSSYKAVWHIPKLIVIANEKCLLLKINTITMFIMLRMKLTIDGDSFLRLLTHYFLIQICE